MTAPSLDALLLPLPVLMQVKGWDYANPIFSIIALARLAAIVLAVWYSARAAIDAIGGDGAAWGKAFMGLFTVVFCHNPLWLISALGLINVSNSMIMPRALCLDINGMCPTSSFEIR